ncbi:MAG: hypothetical protein M3M84_08030 [Thermoproteota archaeon]|nr:hypothetical protein [Thermoproteota archaeon]
MTLAFKAGFALLPHICSKRSSSTKRVRRKRRMGYFNRTGSVFLSIVAATFLCGLLHYNRYRDSERLYVLLIVEQTHTYAGAFRINSYTQNR